MRRDEFERKFTLELPPSRVVEADRTAYRLTCKAEFDKADIEVLFAGARGIVMPAGVVHGSPSYFEMWARDGELLVVLWPSFLKSKGDSSLSMRDEPSWSGRDDNEKSRKFEFTVLRWTVGQRTKAGRWGQYSSRSLAKTMKRKISEAVYDEAGKLKVEMEIEVK